MAGTQSCEFLLGDMNGGGRKVRQAADVVGVAVGENDVLYVLGLKPEPLDLSDRCQSFLELEPRRGDGGLPDPIERKSEVVQTDPRVEERKAVVVFKQQAMARSLRIGRGMENAAVQVVDLHSLDSQASSSLTA